MLYRYMFIVSRGVRVGMFKISRACRNFLSIIFTTWVSISYVLPSKHYTERHEVFICRSIHALPAGSWVFHSVLLVIIHLKPFYYLTELLVQCDVSAELESSVSVADRNLICCFNTFLTENYTKIVLLSFKVKWLKGNALGTHWAGTLYRPQRRQVCGSRVTPYGEGECTLLEYSIDPSLGCVYCEEASYRLKSEPASRLPDLLIGVCISSSHITRH